MRSIKITERTKSFQGIRLILLLAIVCGHSGEWIFTPRGIIIFFFILSGFFSNYSYTNYWAYLKHIFLKMYPIYWLALGTSIILLHQPIVKGIIPFVLLLQSYIPRDDYYSFRFCGVSWFLSSLLLCYITMPLLSYIYSNKSKRSILAIIFLNLIILILYTNIPHSHDWEHWYNYISPFYNLMVYNLGLLLSKLIKDIPNKQLQHSNYIAFLFIIIVGVVFRSNLFSTHSWWIPMIIISYIYVFNPPLISKIFGNKFCIWISKYFMIIYLFHQTIINYIGDSYTFTEKVAIAISVCLIIAIIIEYCSIMIMKLFSK